ncbi:MAG: hypothetical protein RIS47_2264 [Bacteroidota bacterium]
MEEQIKNKAAELGFLACGFAQATRLDAQEAPLAAYLKRGAQGKMAYLENHFEMRLDPRLLVPGAKTVISLAYNYYSDEKQVDVTAPKISKYAYGADYHFVVKDKLAALMAYIRSVVGDFDGRAFVDSAPLLERAWAVRAGLGWVGKNGNVINPNVGSFFFLAEIVLSVDFKSDLPFVANHCGNCTRCMDACPTAAIVSPGMVDGKKCVSYFTIELRDEIPTEMKGKFAGWMFGCDICQDVCPWNRRAKPHTEPLFLPNPKLLTMAKDDWANISALIFDEIFRKSAVKRTKYAGLVRNIAFLNS